MTFELPRCCLSTRTRKVRPSTCTCGRVRLTAPSSPAYITETYVYIHVYVYGYIYTRKVGPSTCYKTHCYLITFQYTDSYVHMDVRICTHMDGKSGALYLHMPTCSLLLRRLPIYNYIRIRVDTYPYVSE